MAISSTCIAEVQTTGSDLNGAIYNGSGSSPGTDYTQGAGQATFSYTDLVIGATTTQATSVARPFTAADNRNGLQIASGTGFTVGFYEMTAESGVTATFDRSLGTTASTGGTGKLGGALASLGKASVLVAQTGILVYQKSGTYSISSVSDGVSGGTMTSSSGNVYTVCGYSTNRNTNNTDTKPVNQFTVANVVMTLSRALYVNIEFDGNGQTGAKQGSTGSDTFLRCMFRNMSATTSGTQVYIGCQATGCSVAVFSNVMQFCEAWGNTATPFNVSVSANFCLSYGNTGATTDGFSCSGATAVFGNSHSYGNGRHGFQLSATRFASLLNCHAEGNGVTAATAYGYNASGGVLLQNSSHYNNKTAGTNGFITIAPQNGVIVTVGSVYTNAGSNDFSLNNLVNQGALLRAAGFPGTFPRGTTPSYLDIGAVQHQDSPALIVIED